MNDAQWPGGLRPTELAYYADGVWYDAEYIHIGGDIPYYSSVAAAAGGPVLELACGTGRLTIPMAQAGADVTGVDLAPGMIERARAKRAELPAADQARLSFEVSDMRSVRLGRRFDAVILAFNTLMHMTRDADLEAVLETVRAHLTPDGLFHLDVHTPHPSVVPRQDSDGRYDPEEMVDPRDRRRYMVSENNRYEARHQINVMRFFYQEVDDRGEPIGDERAVTLKLRVIFPRELDLWLRLAGFELVEEWDDFDKEHPFSGDRGHRIIVARLRDPSS